MFTLHDLRPLRSRRLLPLLGGLLTLGLACGDDSTAPTTSGSTEVEPFLRDLPTWSEFSPPREPADGISGEGAHYTENVDETIYDCTNTPYSLTENPEKVVTLDPDANVLWLGALLQGKGYKDGIGSLAELPIRERAPLTISLDILSADNMRVVQNPSLGTVHQAVGAMVSAAVTSGNRGGSSVSFSQEQMHSVNQAALKLGASAGYMSVSVKASLSASRTAAEKTVTAYFVQKMFTAAVQLPEGPMDFFSDEFTDEVLAQHRAAGRIGADNLPVYVSSITYGRVLMFSFTSTSNITDIRAALSASFSSIAGAEIEARYLDILNKAKISVVTVGGEGKNATALIQNGQLRDYFTEESALTSARPISYTVRNLGDNSIARVSETTEYNIVECMARPQTGEMTIDVSPNNADVTVEGPDNFRLVSKGDQLLRDLKPGGYTVQVSKVFPPATTAVHEEQEVHVEAGSVTDVTVVLHPTVTPGAQFEVSLLKIIPNNLGCTWESEADLFWEFKVNGTVKTSRDEGSAIVATTGQEIHFSANTEVVEICDGQHLSITGWLKDADSNAPDVVATFNTSYIYHDIPTGQRHIVEEVADCKATLYFSIIRLGAHPCSSTVENSFLVSRRPMPLFIEESAADEPEWQTLQLRP
jgi:hypothetical protein